MTMPKFIAWLDGKMAEHASGKLIPPAEVLDAELAKRIEDKVRAAHTERILREAGLDTQVATTIAAIKLPNSHDARKRHQEAVQARTQPRMARSHRSRRDALNKTGPVMRLSPLKV